MDQSGEKGALAMIPDSRGEGKTKGSGSERKEVLKAGKDRLSFFSSSSSSSSSSSPFASSSSVSIYSI